MKRNRLTSVMSALGALVLLTSWLFQHLYAENISAQRAKFESIKRSRAAYESAIPILTAIKAVANDEGTRKEIDELLTLHMSIVWQAYNELDFSELCKNNNAEPKGAANLQTLEGKCKTLRYLLNEYKSEMTRLKGKNTFEKLAELSKEKRDEELKKLQEITTRVNELAVRIFPEYIDQKVARNRIIFISLYTFGSLLLVGSQVIKILK